MSPATGTRPPAGSDPAVSLQPGAVLGPFQIIDRLGVGGMGEVYRALDTRLGRKVALKVLPKELLSNQEGLARFALEARSASALNHPNIVTIFEVGRAESSPYLAMELIDGWTLRQLLDEGPLPVKKTLELATQIANGLAKAHQAGIVHRDLKPENIMVSQDGFVKILDFGLAKLQAPLHGAPAQRDVSLTQVGLIIGTPDYMSPEQAGERALDFRSDQFSAGLVFYEMLTRRRLFHRATPVQTLSAILQEEALPLEGLDSRVPPPLRWAIERCLSKDPAERYGSTLELARELKQIRDKLSDFHPSGERGSRRVEAQPPGERGASSPPQHTRAPMPSMFREASPAPSFMLPSPAAATTAGRVRRVREFGLVLILGFALFLCGAFAGDWFRSKQADAPAPIWKGNLLVGPMTRVMAPRSSPDGGALAFLTLVAGRSQVAVMKPSSGDWTVLTRRGDAGSVSKVCWSRDGDKLYFDRVSDVRGSIFSVPPLGGEERAVLEDAQGPEALADGSLLVVKRDSARNFQIHRFHPGTGALVPVGPAVVAEGGAWSLRAFPDGKSAVFWGRLAGSADPARRVYLLDIATGRATPFAKQLPLAPPLAIGGDGHSVLAFVTFGDLQQAISVSRDGAQGKILFPVTGKPWGLDSGADGSLFVSTMDNPAELLRFPATGGVPDQLVTMAGNLVTSPVALADGGMLIPNQVLGRRRLLIFAPDGQLRPFLESAEQATPPATLVGQNRVAFLSGSVGQPPMITVATMPEGRIVRRIEQTRGIAPQSLVASPDGQTLYYVNAGTLFSVGIEGGEPRSLRPANGVAVDPRGPVASLIVQLNALDGVKLFRVPLDGGSELSILFASPLRLAPIPISGSAVGPDGRIAVTVSSPDSMFRSVALLDPVTAALERLPVVFDGDLQYPAWDHDGTLRAVGVSIRSSLWRFQPQRRSKRHKGNVACAARPLPRRAPPPSVTSGDFARRELMGLCRLRKGSYALAHEVLISYGGDPCAPACSWPSSRRHGPDRFCRGREDSLEDVRTARGGVLVQCRLSLLVRLAPEPSAMQRRLCPLHRQGLLRQRLAGRARCGRHGGEPGRHDDDGLDRRLGLRHDLHRREGESGSAQGPRGDPPGHDASRRAPGEDAHRLRPDRSQDRWRGAHRDARKLRRVLGPSDAGGNGRQDDDLQSAGRRPDSQGVCAGRDHPPDLHRLRKEVGLVELELHVRHVPDQQRRVREVQRGHDGADAEGEGGEALTPAG